MIGTRWMITSAHCITPALPPTAFAGPIAARVRYFKPGGTIPSVTDGNNDGIGDESFEALYAFIFDSYDRYPDFGWDHDSDLALVRRPAGPWARTLSTDYLAISLGVCQQIQYSEFFGRGYGASDGSGAGVLRKTLIDNYDCYTRSFYSLAGDAQICVGDSGGPFIFSNSGVPMISGLFSSADGLPGRNCTTGGGEQWATRLKAKTAWIESKIGWTPAVQTTPEGYSYKQYWF